MSPTLTWDTKITALLAVMNGTTTIIHKFLNDAGLTNEFTARLEKEYAMAFPTITG